MIVKRNFNPLKVLYYVRFELVFAIVIGFIVRFVYYFNPDFSAIPFSVSVILGSALAIFIAFRNNSSYARWWEARTLWAGIVNSSRVLGRLIITFTDSHSHKPVYEKDRSEHFKYEMIQYLVSWSKALKIQLRGQKDWSELESNLSTEDFKYVLTQHSKPNAIQLLMGKKIYTAMANGTLGGFDSFQMEGQLLALTNYQGGCERIKNTPLLRQYDYFTRLFLFAFMLLLPFSLIGEFVKLGLAVWMVPISVLISFVFAIIGKVGEVNEDPFENRITDVPISALCNEIERDLLAMVGNNEIPNELVDINGYLH